LSIWARPFLVVKVDFSALLPLLEPLCAGIIHLYVLPLNAKFREYNQSAYSPTH
jgi:hypothetical protein